MPDPQPTLDLDALKALVANATPGPWVTGDKYDRCVMHPHELVISPHQPLYELEFAGDAAFIAAAREAVPALLAELARTRPVVEMTLAAAARLRRMGADLLTATEHTILAAVDTYESQEGTDGRP